MWGDRFEVVVATHLNKEHLHNHFVINSVSFIDGKKYYDNTANYNRMKKISDRLCEEYNLSVIRNPKGKSKHYAEWLAEKKGYPTIRGQIRDELDEIIKCSYTMNEFWRILKERGFEICRRKPQYAYTSFIPPYGTKQVRLDSYGELVDIANGAIFHYRNAYLRPNFYAENVERVRRIITSVIEDYKDGKITYAEAEFNARVKIYQSINPSFNPDIEFAKDPIYRDIPPVDNSLFAIARKLILESK